MIDRLDPEMSRFRRMWMISCISFSFRRIKLLNL